jgi:nucleoside-diphosphate-sugar epimerase
LSTVKVHGEKNPNDRPFDESDAPSPQSSYGKSKLSAEHELYAVAKSTGMEIVILRPVMVYGPGTRGNLQALARVAVLGIPLPFGSIENARSLLSIFNLADFVSAVVHHPAAANEVFLVSDGEDVSTPDLFRLLARMRGRRLRLLPVPLAPMRLLATLAGRAADFDRLTESLSVNSSKASRVLGWQPTLSLEEGLRRTLRDEDLGARRHL